MVADACTSDNVLANQYSAINSFTLREQHDSIPDCNVQAGHLACEGSGAEW
jgi:hypothetical protein